MPEPSSEQWLALHEAFREYCNTAPWQWLDDTQLVAVEHPTAEYRGYCAVLGSGGHEYGLGVYRGDEGLAGYLALMSGDIAEGTYEILDFTNSVSAVLADRELLTKEERDLIRSLGLRYRGRGRWPLFQTAQPGHLPWKPDSDATEFLTFALRSIIDLAPSLEKGELSVDPTLDSRRLLVRSFQDGEWFNRWETILFPIPQPALNYPDLERLRQLAESRLSTGSVWELSIFYFHSPIRQGRDSRPYFPVMAMLVHTDSLFPLTEHFMDPDPSDVDRQELVVKLLETLPGLPSEIIVSTPRLAQLVQSVTTPLGIVLTVDETPAIWSLREELYGQLDELDEDC